MYRMIFDIVRFNTFATDLLDTPEGEGGTSLQRYLDENGYSCAFRDNYLIVPPYPSLLSLPVPLSSMRLFPCPLIFACLVLVSCPTLANSLILPI